MLKFEFWSIFEAVVRSGSSVWCGDAGWLFMGGVLPGMLEIANGHFFRGILKMIMG